MLDNFNDEPNFRPNLLLTNKQAKNFCKGLVNNFIVRTRFLAKTLEPLMKFGLLLMKNVHKPLTKSVLMP